MAEAGDKKKRTFRKFTYRGVDLEGLIDMPFDKVDPVIVHSSDACFLKINSMSICVSNVPEPINQW